MNLQMNLQMNLHSTLNSSNTILAWLGTWFNLQYVGVIGQLNLSGERILWLTAVIKDTQSFLKAEGRKRCRNLQIFKFKFYVYFDLKLTLKDKVTWFNVTHRQAFVDCWVYWSIMSFREKQGLLLVIGVCRTPMWSTRPVFRNRQFEHSELHWIKVNVDVTLWHCEVTWRQVFATMKKDVTDTSSLWLTVHFC